MFGNFDLEVNQLQWHRLDPNCGHRLTHWIRFWVCLSKRQVQEPIDWQIQVAQTFLQGTRSWKVNRCNDPQQVWGRARVWGLNLELLSEWLQQLLQETIQILFSFFWSWFSPLPLVGQAHTPTTPSQSNNQMTVVIIIIKAAWAPYQFPGPYSIHSYCYLPFNECFDSSPFFNAFFLCPGGTFQVPKGEHGSDQDGPQSSILYTI